MEQLARLTELVTASPGITTVGLRDALWRDGRVSITTADVLRTLVGEPRRFRLGPPADQGWWPAALVSDGPAAAQPFTSPAPTPWPPPVAGSRTSTDLARPVLWTNPRAFPEMYTWQRAALTSWRAAGQRGVVEAVTGTGKTMVGLVASVEELARRGQVLVLVPTGELLVQWHRAVDQIAPVGTSIGLLGMGHNDRLGDHDLLIAIVNSARDADLAPRRPGGLLIGDECHRYASSENRRALIAGFHHRLGLSATFARPDDGHIDWLAPYFGATCYRLGYEQASREGVIAPFDVVLVGLEFSPAERDIYVEHDDAMVLAAGKLIGRFGVPTEPAGAFLAAVSALAQSDDEAGKVARQYLYAMRERRRVLDDAGSKQEMLSALAPSISHADRTLIFTSSIEAADRGADALSGLGLHVAAIHSALNSTMRRERMESFRTGRLTTLVAPQVLDEGIDVAAADLAIVLGATRSRRQMVQRMGRVVRRKPDGRRARFVVGYIRGTVEDPAFGAHELFLDEITTVARALETYSPAHDGWAGLVDLLRPFRP